MCIVRMCTPGISKLSVIISTHDHDTKERTEKTYWMIQIIGNDWFLHTEIKSRGQPELNKVLTGSWARYLRNTLAMSWVV